MDVWYSMTSQYSTPMNESPINPTFPVQIDVEKA
jgi:hypothetical protein